VEARRAGVSAQLEAAGRSLKGVFKHADRLGARHVAVVEGGGVALRDMASGTQEDALEPGAALTAVLRGSR
jgi:histidyl-tRNA synthetase